MGYSLFSGVPCSSLKNLINCAINDSHYVGAANEGDAVAIASGAYLCGKYGVALMQNSGLTNATSPLTSLNDIFKIPILGFVSLRGEPGIADEPQHELMGQITTGMLSLMKIPWEYLSKDTKEALEQLKKAQKHIEKRQSYFFVVRKGTLSKVDLMPFSARSKVQQIFKGETQTVQQPHRYEAIQAVLNAVQGPAVIIATTGYTGRELYRLQDSESHFYMVGSMGCASSLGLGVALSSSELPVIVIDGDGSMLMRMGSLTTNAYHAPGNLLQLVLDNQVHDSTGGQMTVTENVDFAGIARSCGYPVSLTVNDCKSLSEEILHWYRNPQLTLIHLKTAKGTPHELPRPAITPPEVVTRLRKYIKKH